MTLLYYFFLFCFLLLNFILCVVILLQESKSSGLSSSFDTSSSSLFGTSTPKILKQFTAYLAVGFLTGCLILSFWTESLGRKQRAYTPPKEITE